MLRARVTGTQRSRSLVQTAVLLLVVLTFLTTFSSVKHLASAIASRHALTEVSSISDASTDSGSRKRLQLAGDTTDGGLPLVRNESPITLAIARDTTQLGKPGQVTHHTV